MVAKSLFDLAARQGATLTLLDIGGGFPGWDGSECVYHRRLLPPDLAPEATDDAPPVAPASTALPSSTGQPLSPPDGTTSGDGGASRTCTSPVQRNGDAANELQRQGERVVTTTPPPPLSLAEIARVTLPVLNALFPPSSGVQVTGLAQLRAAVVLLQAR